ncbi:MAG: hypothetical protein GWP14_05450 [Actinobacteria bacterium]|nr:hypothetical protein [Actinomycetota bacterium]
MASMNYPPLPLTIFFAVLIVIWLLATLKQRYRTASISGLANELRLRIFPRDPLNIPQRYEQLYLFGHGHARRARNVMIGHYHGRPIRVFDYLYETGLGLDRRTQRFSVVMTQADRGWPALLVHPAESERPLYNLSGLEEVHLPEIQNKHQYAVFCEYEEFVRNNIRPDMVEKIKQNSGAILEICGGMLALYVPRKLKPAQYRRLIELAGELTEQLSTSSSS